MDFSNYPHKTPRDMRPKIPAPSVVPQLCPGHYNAEPKIIIQYLFSFIYIWTEGGFSFWMYPVALVNDIVHGYMWDGGDWIYTPLDRQTIISIH